jgi:alanyl-tRNA synthetase
MKTTAELREGFLSFFESKGHTRHPSGSLVPPEWDRSTLLTSAGMQPLMPYFLGREQPPAPLLTTVQKCFRTPDIDEVGLDGHHLTFFEMLGNFSFGQYFKEGAIDLAWEFVFDHLHVDPDRFWVTVFAGDPELGLGEDEEAIRLWEAKGLAPERIVRLGRAHNFWSVGGPGPCGPDTELFYDRGEEVGCGRPGCAPGCECERFLEFWNLVFMEYELHADGSVTPLPKQNVDTGMGLERTTSILQDVISVYETDGYQAIMKWIADESGVVYGESETATKAHRVLADHGRGMTFLVADGVRPGNEGRGYVLRRIIRRAIVHGHDIGLRDFLPGLADVVTEQMGDAYPVLVGMRETVKQMLAAEEGRFGKTLEFGEGLFEEEAVSGAISGETAFKLHDTYGYPIEVTLDRARSRGLPVDEEGFQRLMAEQRERSRAGAKGEDARAAEFAAGAGFTTDFVGYEKTDVLTQIGALEDLGDGQFLAKLRESPFYPAGGGQVSDAGFLEHEETGARAELVEAHRVGDDQALVFRGDGFSAGDRVRAVVPWAVRFPTMANHTATHLLHQALREVLGDHVRQAGSAVRPDKLRFDFTHEQALTPEQRDEIEQRVNAKVFESLPVRAFVTPIEEARNLGAMMLFGEKYGDEVRVVEIPGFSRELCGGTHVRTTAEIGPFVITSESSVGAGARRIEALTSAEAFAYLSGRAHEAQELREELERTRREAKKKPAAAGADVTFRDESGGVVVAEVSAMKGSELRDLSDQIRRSKQADAVLLGSVDNGRAYLVVNLDSSLVEKGADAVAVVREAAKKIDGGGGGRPTLAEAGGKNPAGLEEAYEVGKRQLASAIE